MQRSLFIIKPVISNVVSTCDLTQFIDFNKLKKYAWAIYDQAIYGGICAYIKISGMRGKVTLFSNGKMISIGANSIDESKKQFFQAKHLLLQSKLISEVKIKPKIVNIVATLTLNCELDLSKISKKLSNSEFDPNCFAGIIWRNPQMPTCLIFRTGKIVIVGSKSKKQLSEISEKIQQELHKT